MTVVCFYVKKSIKILFFDEKSKILRNFNTWRVNCINQKNIKSPFGQR